MSVQYVKQFNADMGELSLNLSGETHWRRFSSGKIDGIRIAQGKRKVLFMEKPVDRIEIIIHGEKAPYVIEKGKIKDDFEWIKEVLKKFADKNKVQYS